MSTLCIHSKYQTYHTIHRDIVDMARSFTFVDLFAGIGGFHQGCMKASRNTAKCILACEIDEGAASMYKKNYGITPHNDIRTLDGSKYFGKIDLLCAGFPCQSYSSLGHRKGLRDTRGRLFYNLCSFIESSKPKVLLLENVKALVNSPNFGTIISKIESLGYDVCWGVFDTANFKLPQHRERVYIVAVRTGHKCFEGLKRDFEILKNTVRPKVPMDRFIDANASMDPSLDFHIFDHLKLYDPPVATDAGFLLRAKLSNYTNRKLFSSHGLVGTIATGGPPPIYDERSKKIRHLSKKELLRCQGFPANFKIPQDVSRSYVVHYVGNAVSVNVVSEIVSLICRHCW